VKYGEQVSCQASTFLQELDGEHLLMTSYEEVFGREANEDELSNFFNSMKDMLNG
jgi:hypothetical protein